ncbi:protein NLP6-like isoform X1 [Camellia sinensis]|uniref:PB1 domain-containing protein n=1 Tax=Camellia sinensis var. sinensis TaxID=542762 RepID=A0A4S4DB13_CAMSN|nr:protein NLP6-like isoform X1 [Camellia sinensis]THF99758.1 hypothetical protein TEA_005395 [Camellia sinensis var. sinensis]
MAEEFFSYLSDDFKEYMFKELNWLLSKYFYGVVFWSREDDEPQRPSTLPDGDISYLNKIIRDLLYTIMYGVYGPPYPVLIQFWAPITTKEGRSFLTTRNQPFSLTYNPPDMEGFLGYRMICMDSKFDIDLDGGKTCEQHLPARVFKHQFPESTPNVEFYSITEYPQRHDALRCRVRHSLAFPVFESSTQRCVGVIEVVTPEKDLSCSLYFEYSIYKDFEKFGLKCSVVFDHEAMELDDDKNEAHKVAFDEIKNMLKRVCDVHDVPFAQAWVPCKMGCPCRALVDGGILHASCCYKKVDYGEDEDGYDYDEDDYGEYDDFRHVSSLSHSKNGVGVVGRALLSTNMVFCRDVTQLSLTEYPLAHYAREAGLSGCFAICLESNCTGNDVYVLEFFMPMSNNASENPHTSLRKILETMKKNLSCFRVASREELGEELHIEEISIQNGEKLDPVQIPQTTISLPRLELSQSKVAVMQVDSSDQQLVNAINTGSNAGGTEHSNFAIACTQEKSTVKVSKMKGNKSGGTVKASKREGNNKIKIPLEDILQNSALSLENAAKNLKVSKSTLKRVCRPYGVKRWPPHINKVGCSQLDESAPCVNSDHLPSTQSLATIVHTEPYDTTMQDANIVTIKAKYGEGVTIKFPLSLSSSFLQLQQEVAKRLDLKAGTYYVKYEDEDGELILIGCDEDLQDYMHDSRSLGRSSIVVLLEQKLPITDHKKEKIKKLLITHRTT